MGLVKLSELLHHARKEKYAVGYFEAWDMYSMEAVLEAAEAEKSPVMLGFGGMMMEQQWLDRFGIEAFGAYGRVIAERANVPTALILNEVWQLEHAMRGANSGFNVVMANTCELPFEENVRLTRELTTHAHAHDVEVQAELGRLPDYGEDDVSVLTDPDEAARFVELTQVDCLAVSIGNMHLRTEGKAVVDIDRLRAIRRKVDIPLVIHGGSGFPDDVLPEVIRAGVVLFHLGTIMKKQYLEAAIQTLADVQEPHQCQSLTGSRKSTDFLIPGKQAITETVRRALRRYGSSGMSESATIPGENN